jgi:hypothetical protein
MRVRFVLAVQQVSEVNIGAGSPSWTRAPRVYFRYADGAGKEQMLNLNPLDISSDQNMRRAAQVLSEKLLKWRFGRSESDMPMSLPRFDSLTAPAFGNVTSLSPKIFGKPGRMFRTYAVKVLPLVLVTYFVLGVPMWYPALVAFALRVIEAIPYWRYREGQAARLVRAPEMAEAAP